MATRTKTKKNGRQDATPGFAIRINEDTDLGIAMLLCEDEEGHYEPIGPCASIKEAWEIAASNMQYKRRELERDGDPGLCPWVYKIWAVGLDGVYRVAGEIHSSGL